jgi:hypothetical protein
MCCSAAVGGRHLCAYATSQRRIASWPIAATAINASAASWLISLVSAPVRPLQTVVKPGVYSRRKVVNYLLRERMTERTCQT